MRKIKVITNPMASTLCHLVSHVTNKGYAKVVLQMGTDVKVYYVHYYNNDDVIKPNALLTFTTHDDKRIIVNSNYIISIEPNLVMHRLVWKHHNHNFIGNCIIDEYFMDEQDTQDLCIREDSQDLKSANLCTNDYKIVSFHERNYVVR